MARGIHAGRVSAQTLRGEWLQRSVASGWSFPSDWDCPAVDAVCECAQANTDIWPAVEQLGRSRAAAGVGLGETLADIDALVPLLPASYADILRRAASLGWAERILAPAAGISDPLTGLVSREYLQIRLAEVYQAAEARRTDVSQEYALAVVRIDLTGRSAWQRTLPMILVSESLRTVFDGGETLALLGEPMAVALAVRDEVLPRRIQLAARLITSRTAADPDAKIAPPRVWTEPLPSTYSAARALIEELGR